MIDARGIWHVRTVTRTGGQIESRVHLPHLQRVREAWWARQTEAAHAAEVVRALPLPVAVDLQEGE